MAEIASIIVALRKALVDWREKNPSEGDPTGLRMHGGTIRQIAFESGVWPPRDKSGNIPPYDPNDEPDWYAEGATIFGIPIHPDRWMIVWRVELMSLRTAPPLAPWIVDLAPDSIPA